MAEDTVEEAEEGGWVGDHDRHGFLGWCVLPMHTKYSDSHHRERSGQENDLWGRDRTER